MSSASADDRARACSRARRAATTVGSPAKAELCRKMGLLAKASVAIDGSKFKAVNSRDNNFNPTFIVAAYEVMANAGQSLDAGGRVAVKLGHDAVLGVTGVHDESSTGRTGSRAGTR